ncbi:MAG: hypothetical protein JNM27_23325 [Leptospirales bacterium]|nr:hypothetical protein [Leptospirales bacterium]
MRFLSVSFFLCAILLFYSSGLTAGPCEAPYFCGLIKSSPETLRAIPLAPRVSYRGLPSKVDLSDKMPPPAQQLSGDCAAFALAYALKSYQEQAERNWGYDSPVIGGPGNRVFSPTYLYNQLTMGGYGMSLAQGLEAMVEQGVAPWAVTPYTPADFRTPPTPYARQAALNYRISRFYKLPNEVEAIKAEVAAGRPVVIGIFVDSVFVGLGAGVYDRNSQDGTGGPHGMVIVGYDDNIKSPRGYRGAFKVINSWGRQWGSGGFGWIAYNHMLVSYPELYAVYDAREDSPPPATITAPPSEVRASRGRYSDRIVVSWSPVPNANAYSVQRETSPGRFSAIDYTVKASVTDRDVLPEVVHRYRVIAIFDAKAQSDPASSPIAEGYASTAPAGRPDKVVGLEGRTASASGGVVLTWSSLGSGATYQVFRYSSASKQWQPIAHNVSDATFTDAAALLNQKLAYTVRAISGSQAGPYSEPFMVIVGTALTIPAPPLRVRASKLSEDRVRITWDPVPGASSYHVERIDIAPVADLDAPPPAYPPPVKLGITQQNALEDKNSLKAGYSYMFYVIAANSAGKSDTSFPGFVDGPSPYGSRSGLIPQAPEGSIDGATVRIAWQPVANATTYVVYRQKQGGATERIASVKTNSYTGSFGGEPGTAYFYTIAAVSGQGVESEKSAPVVLGIRSNVRTRVMGDRFEGTFRGTWKGLFTDRTGKSHTVTLTLVPQGQALNAQLQVDGASAEHVLRRLAGSQTADGQMLNLTIQSDTVLYMEINDPVFGPVSAGLSR